MIQHKLPGAVRTAAVRLGLGPEIGTDRDRAVRMLRKHLVWIGPELGFDSFFDSFYDDEQEELIAAWLEGVKSVS